MTRTAVATDEVGWTPPVALTIAGSDSGGGAGIQADLRTFAAFGVHGCTAIAALTAQNTHEVRGVVATDPGFLRDQIEAVLDDLPVAAVKTGMLATAANVRVVAELAAAGRLPNLVVDPVMVSSSGARLLDDDAVNAYVEELLPHALITTPNLREVRALLNVEGSAGLSAQQLGRLLLRMLRRAGPPHGRPRLEYLDRPLPIVVSTGGDSELRIAVDAAVWDPATHDHLLLGGETSPLDLSAPRVDTINNHGTGCSFASAVAAQLAHGVPPLDAIRGAKTFVHDAIVRAAGWRLGAGHGPIDHLDFAHPRHA